VEEAPDKARSTLLPVPSWRGPAACRTACEAAAPATCPADAGRVGQDMIHRIVPNLKVGDARAGHDFYVDFLGLKKQFDLG
jgi:hypothetical protein